MKSKTARAFELFEEGKTASSPEVKALGLKPSSRYSLLSQWKHGKREPKAEVTTTLPKGESVGGIDEVKAEKATGEVKKEVEKEQEPELEPKKGEEPREMVVAGEEGEKKGGIPENIIGEGLDVRVRLSVATLALYQIVYTAAGNDLSLGDFLDSCAEDFFLVRGKGLGLVEKRR